jgi:hypothetical protein
MRMTQRTTYVALAVGFAAGGLIATLFARSRVRDLLRERGKDSIEFMKERATRLRAAGEDIAKRAREFVGPQHNAIETDSEAEKQAYQEEKRNTLGG